MKRLFILPKCQDTHTSDSLITGQRNPIVGIDNGIYHFIENCTAKYQNQIFPVIQKHLFKTFSFKHHIHDHDHHNDNQCHTDIRLISSHT